MVPPGDNSLAATRLRGLPNGNLTSQFWANYYLNSFDHFVTIRIRPVAYLCFADDFLLFDNDKLVPWAALAALQKYLARLRLTTHPEAHPFPVTQGIPSWILLFFPKTTDSNAEKGYTISVNCAFFSPATPT